MKSLYTALPLVAFAVVLGGLLVQPHGDAPLEPRDVRLNEALFQEAYSAVARAESRQQHRFSEAIDPEAAETALQERLALAIEARIEEEVAKAGGELFVRDRGLKRPRKTAAEANRCASCHSRAGAGGAGGLVDNFLGGRNPPALGGAILLERLAAEMTAELWDDAKAGRPLVAKGITFGTADAPEGIARDRVVRPFGRGRWSTLDDAIAAMGTDALGIELSANERAALRAWIAALPAPGFEPPDAARTPDLFQQFSQGRRRFDSLGCANCHVPEILLGDGTRIGAFTDLKFHELGAELAEKGKTKHLTAPLWGLAATAPWLHDGRALASLDAAILAHGGEAESSRMAYQKLDIGKQGELKTFLLSLAPAPKLQIAGQ